MGRGFNNPKKIGDALYGWPLICIFNDLYTTFRPDDVWTEVYSPFAPLHLFVTSDFIPLVTTVRPIQKKASILIVVFHPFKCGHKVFLQQRKILPSEHWAQSLWVFITVGKDWSFPPSSPLFSTIFNVPDSYTQISGSLHLLFSGVMLKLPIHH